MNWRPMSKTFSTILRLGLAWVLLSASGSFMFETAAADIEPEPVVAALHVHSTASTGSLSFDEIGAKIGRSSEAARKLWSRAIQQLQRELDGLNESQE